MLNTASGDVPVTPQLAKLIYRYLVKNDYSDDKDQITEVYHQAKEDEQLAELPEDLKPYAEQVFQLIDSVFTDANLPDIDDDRAAKLNPLNANFHKREFQELWQRINQKAAYTVHFDTDELLSKCVAALDRDLRVSPLRYVVQRGEQLDEANVDSLKSGQAFTLKETEGAVHETTVHSTVRYDLLGKLAEHTQLTRRTIAGILQGISKATFNQYPTNPEDFILKAARLINEQKATVIVEHLAYDPIEECHELDIFTREQPKASFDRAIKANRHVYDYVFTDSKTERAFVSELDTSAEVVVYAKLPGGFFIPTPVGNYNPDWAIAFQEGKVKHIYFIAETKGSMSSLELRDMEKSKIQCARKFFAKITSDEVKYDVVDSYSKLMELVA